MKNHSLRKMGVLSMAMAAFHAAALAAPALEFDAHFSPAFLPKSHLHLKPGGHAGVLAIEIEELRASVPVRAEVMEAFARKVQQIPRKPAAYKVGLDGCGVVLRLNVAGQEVFHGHVWSPTKQSAPSEDAMLRELYAVVDQTEVPSPQREYLEFLFGYMNDIQPFWKKTTGPDGAEWVRMRGSMSSDDIPAFRELIATLPADRETTFDITNLGNTGTLFHKEILKASQEHLILWRASKPWSELLLKIGVPKRSILEVKE